MAPRKSALKPTEPISAELPKPARVARADKRAKVKDIVSDEEMLRRLKKKTLDKRAAVAVKDAVLKPKRGSLKPEPTRQTRKAASAEEKKTKAPASRKLSHRAAKKPKGL